MDGGRLSSCDISTQLYRIHSRLAELRDAENDYESGGLSPTRESGSVSSSLHAADDSDLDSSTLHPSSATSGWTSPFEQWTKQTTPLRDQSPSRVQPTMIQIKKEEKKTWFKSPKKGYQTTIKYFYQEIDSSWTVVSIVACFFVSGLVDCMAFSVGGVFVAMQTGNTMFLALRIAGQPPAHQLTFLRNLTSLLCYCLGALFFNCLHRASGGLANTHTPLHRWTLLTSFAMQSGLLLIAAILAQTSIIAPPPNEGPTFTSTSARMPHHIWLDLVGIGLLAFEAAGQVCLSRVLLANELPTIVLSTLYHDLIGQALGLRKSWKDSPTTWDFLVKQKKQIRRVACILSLFCGALVGGLILYQSPGGLAAGLWLATGVKICICVAWCLWKKKIVTETVVKLEPST